MLGSIFIATILFGLCGTLHYVVMAKLLSTLPKSPLPRGLKLIIGLYALGIVHLAEAGFYAFGFLIGRGYGLGGFEQDSGPLSLMDVYYFSLVNFTSLGLGDIYPTGHLRFLAGVESLNGFLLISCSAVFIYLLMSNGRPYGED